MRNIALFLLLVMFSNTAWASQQYTCPMHPHYIAVKQGSCPICGMDLVAIAEDGQPEIDDNGSMENKKIITIAPETIQNIGVRTARAEATRFGADVRSYGVVAENIRLRQEISSRVGGWIKNTQVTAIGDVVKKNDLLFTLYSPDLVSAQQDYISSLSAGVQGRISSTAKRLNSLGVQDKVLVQIRKAKQPLQNLPFYSTVGGIISALNIKNGTYVKPGMQIAEIQDYSSVWINVNVAEKDLRFLEKNMVAEVRFPNISNNAQRAHIDYIYPTIDSASRTGKVRLVLANPDGVFRPGSYTDVTFETISVKRLAIPSEAILRSSDGDYVVIALSEGRFQSRKIKTGIRNKGRTQILAGINEGEEIVVSSQFLIDSESSLREAFRKTQKIQAPLALLEVDNDQMAMINHLVDGAIYLQKSLVGQVKFDKKMLMPSLQLGDHLIKKYYGTKLQHVLENAEKAMRKANESTTDSEVRASLSELMMALKPWLFEGRPQYYKEKGLYVFMDHSSGKLWLQLTNEPNNPYGDGHAMLQEWPDKIDAKMPEMSAQPVGGGHAGH
jgi:Cu(I)/Ag(I) efflux system membrane fusion protein